MNWENINPKIQTLSSDFLNRFQIQLDVLRLDEVHPIISGNKWFKLKYNVEEYLKGNYKGIISFGGAYSNHLAAFSYLTPLFNIPTIAIVRGQDGILYPTPTLNYLKQNGTEIIYVSRTEYKLRNDGEYLNQLQNQYPDYYIIPEGGSNDLGIKGCSDINLFIKNSYDYLAVSVGTSSTLKGLLLSSQNNIKHFLGFSSLKGDDLITPDIHQFLKQQQLYKSFQIINKYHFGGFGKSNPELLNFMIDFKNSYQLELDVVYTSKMFYGLLEMIKEGEIPSNSKILAIHTGGLQGNDSLNVAGRSRSGNPVSA